MSWQDAKAKAETIYTELRTHHDHGYIGMVIDALKRLHARDKPKARDEKKISPQARLGNRNAGKPVAERRKFTTHAALCDPLLPHRDRAALGFATRQRRSSARSPKLAPAQASATFSLRTDLWIVGMIVIYACEEYSQRVLKASLEGC
jgi:hypothetical protein